MASQKTAPANGWAQLTVSGGALEQWLYHLIAERRQAPATVNLAINAVRFCYGGLLGRNIESLLRRIKRLRGSGFVQPTG